MNYSVPELLAPAGSIEKLAMVLAYGADAVYLGGTNYSLRQSADNFSNTQLVEAAQMVRKKGAKMFVVLNAFLHDEDLAELPSFLRILQENKIAGVIVSDLGVIDLVQKHSSLPIHLSTQASCLNVSSAKWYGKLGVKRIILGREVSIATASKIKEESGLEVEMFIHGAMCSAYSGNCTISNYTRGRDANRGGCAHNCRVEYQLKDGTAPLEKDFFMSSKDLQGLSLIGEFAKYGIDSVKIEGRNKGAYYAGMATKVYAQALASYSKKGFITSEEEREGREELAKLAHRQYYQGNLLDSVEEDSIYHRRLHQESDYTIAGLVLQVLSRGEILVQAKCGLTSSAQLELIPFRGSAVALRGTPLNLQGKSCSKINPGMLFKIPSPPSSVALPYNIVRTKVS